MFHVVLYVASIRAGSPEFDLINSDYDFLNRFYSFGVCIYILYGLTT